MCPIRPRGVADAVPVDLVCDDSIWLLGSPSSLGYDVFMRQHVHASIHCDKFAWVLIDTIPNGRTRFYLHGHLVVPPRSTYFPPGGPDISHSLAIRCDEIPSGGLRPSQPRLSYIVRSLSRHTPHPV